MHKVECVVPWLNDALVYFTVSLQLCQQLKDKVCGVLWGREERAEPLLLGDKSIPRARGMPECPLLPCPRQLGLCCWALPQHWAPRCLHSPWSWRLQQGLEPRGAPSTR